MRESSMESSAMRTRDDTVTSSLASVILHACSEFCVRFWDCPLVRYDNANMIPRMVIRYHPSLTGYNIPHAICWYNRICCVQLKVLIFEGSSHTWTYSYSNDKWSVIVELSLQTRPNTCKHYTQLILDGLLQGIRFIYNRLNLRCFSRITNDDDHHHNNNDNNDSK